MDQRTRVAQSAVQDTEAEDPLVPVTPKNISQQYGTFVSSDFQLQSRWRPITHPVLLRESVTNDQRVEEMLVEHT